MVSICTNWDFMGITLTAIGGCFGRTGLPCCRASHAGSDGFAELTVA